MLVDVELQNPHASAPLVISLPLVATATAEQVIANIRQNSATNAPWLKASDAHDGVAVIVGGGPSLKNTTDQIIALKAAGASVFAANGASKFIRLYGIPTDYQVILDARRETADLVDDGAHIHLFASQVHPACLERIPSATLFHNGGTLEIESYLPAAKVEAGNYVILGGETAGMAAMACAYAMGYREMHVFGFDSSYEGRASHAYEQPLNDAMACVDVDWAGKHFRTSIAMKGQAERFQIFALSLIGSGCRLQIYGDGLLQTIWRTPFKDLSERNKYQLMWFYDSYRQYSPGANLVSTFLDIVNPPQGDLIIDFGCGTGKAAISLDAAGHSVLLTDFADNCRDQEALGLPFAEHDLTRPCPFNAPYGLCADVLEHVPEKDVPTVIRNIMGAAERVLFQVSTVEDAFGQIVGHPLHQTVKPHAWWSMWFGNLGKIEWQEDRSNASLFYVSRKGEN